MSRCFSAHAICCILIHLWLTWFTVRCSSSNQEIKSQFSELLVPCQTCHLGIEFHVSILLKLRNSASSFHWLSSSIFTVCLFVCRRSSRIGDTSSHLHYMMFQTIQTIYFLWGYDPGNMSVSTYAELSPVYRCLVSLFFYVCCFLFYFLSLSVSLFTFCRFNSQPTVWLKNCIKLTDNWCMSH